MTISCHFLVLLLVWSYQLFYHFIQRIILSISVFSFSIFFLLGKTTMTQILFYLLNELIYFNWRLITLQYCSGFCHSLTWISHGFTCVPHPEPPSHLPPHPIPQGYASTPALSTLSHALNLDWWSVSHMIIYTFQCYSLKSSNPCLLPESKSLFFTSVSPLLSRI